MDLASANRGRRTVKNTPVRSTELTAYLRCRGGLLGHSHLTTFQTIRRQFGTDIMRVPGPDLSRLIMGHNADSRTLDKDYLNFAPVVKTHSTRACHP